MSHTRNHHKTQGSQTHPGGPGDAHSSYQPGTHRSRVCRDILKSQTNESNLHPEIPGTHTASK